MLTCCFIYKPLLLLQRSISPVLQPLSPLFYSLKETSSPNWRPYKKSQDDQSACEELRIIFHCCYSHSHTVSGSTILHPVSKRSNRSPGIEENRLKSGHKKKGYLFSTILHNNRFCKTLIQPVALCYGWRRQELAPHLLGLRTWI